MSRRNLYLRQPPAQGGQIMMILSLDAFALVGAATIAAAPTRANASRDRIIMICPPWAGGWRRYRFRLDIRSERSDVLDSVVPGGSRPPRGQTGRPGPYRSLPFGGNSRTLPTRCSLRS